MTLFLTVTSIDHRNWCGVYCVPCSASVLLGFVVHQLRWQSAMMNGAEKAGDAEVDNNKALT